MQQLPIRDYLNRHSRSPAPHFDWGEWDLIPRLFKGVKLEIDHEDFDVLKEDPVVVNVNRVLALWLSDLSTAQQSRLYGHVFIEVQDHEIHCELCVSLPLSFGISRAHSFLKQHSLSWKKNAQSCGAIFKYKLYQNCEERSSNFKLITVLKRLSA